MDVEQLAAWAYRDQRVDRHEGAGLHAIEAAVSGLSRQRSSTDGCAVLERIAHLGCRLPVGSKQVADKVHAAAEAVAASLNTIEGGDIVAHYARTGGRPVGWSMPKRCYAPVLWIDVGVSAAWERTDDGRGRFTPLIVLGSETAVEARRAEYAIWWNALDMLAWRLSMKALGFVVLRPGAPREPWHSRAEFAA
ncbi:hypothetical protein [uncultured Sphingomonas sp.]|uniref:hypothetical protein n=1 Tax=uncultured Sphingomonas sp. TaxID=158754 RepID=UPI0025D838CB|nr:hypothetical protein [uncultured Sphingomonas sp.]